VGQSLVQERESSSRLWNVVCMGMGVEEWARVWYTL
jgi:hypothetical protein